jgi:predicted nucleic acid-binding protein
MYLLDTNVWLEALLEQERKDEVVEFLATIPLKDVHISDFAFHSLCLLLLNANQQQTLVDFVEDMLTTSGVFMIAVEPEHTKTLLETMSKFNLTFDDAYEYFIAESQNFILISFDTDFDQTPRGKKTPAEVLAQLP